LHTASPGSGLANQDDVTYAYFPFMHFHDHF
jgi:hypothetical protein